MNHKILNLQYRVTTAGTSINQVISPILQHQKRGSHSYWRTPLFYTGPSILLFYTGPAFMEFTLGHLLTYFSLEESEVVNVYPYPSNSEEMQRASGLPRVRQQTWERARVQPCAWPKNCHIVWQTSLGWGWALSHPNDCLHPRLSPAPIVMP